MPDKMTREEMTREETIAALKELRTEFVLHFTQGMSLWLKLAAIADDLARK